MDHTYYETSKNGNEKNKILFQVICTGKSNSFFIHYNYINIKGELN